MADDDVQVVSGSGGGGEGRAPEPDPSPSPHAHAHSPNVDLLQFIQQTINKNTKDRNLILRTEAEMLQFISSGR